MLSPDTRDRLTLLTIGLLVVLGPVLILGFTLGVLVLFGELAIGQLTPIEFLELYVIELLLFVAFAYAIYRLTLWTVINKVPATLDSLHTTDTDSAHDGESESRDEP